MLWPVNLFWMQNQSIMSSCNKSSVILCRPTSLTLFCDCDGCCCLSHRMKLYFFKLYWHKIFESKWILLFSEFLSLQSCLNSVIYLLASLINVCLLYYFDEKNNNNYCFLKLNLSKLSKLSLHPQWNLKLQKSDACQRPGLLVKN